MVSTPMMISPDAKVDGFFDALSRLQLPGERGTVSRLFPWPTPKRVRDGVFGRRFVVFFFGSRKESGNFYFNRF